MKAGIITHYDVHNHGAHLQLYALIQVLKTFGCEAKALQFSKNYDFIGGVEAGKKYNISIRSIPFYLKYLLSNGLSRTLYNIGKRKILANFRKNHNLVGAYYSQADDLDIVVIGSDEIFSIETGPNPWYYGMGIPCTNQISYAASFGPTTLDMIQRHNVGGLIKAGLENLKSISVRDQNSCDLVQHFTNKTPIIVCDPVLLYNFPKQINEDVISVFRKNQKEKYCVVYSYDYNMNDDATVNSIRKYALERNLKVYSVGYFHKWCDKNINLDPLAVFKWFAGAEMVFTNTFHGTVISLATGTQFVSKIHKNGNKLSYLLGQYGVANRKVDDFSSIEAVVKNPINYAEIGKIIAKIRDFSMEYLRNSLESK